MAVASGISCCDAAPAAVAELFASLMRTKLTDKEVKTKQQHSREITASVLVASQHAGRQPIISSAFSRVSTGANDAMACQFYGADTPHAIDNTQLWKDVVEVIIKFYASAGYGYPDRRAASAAGGPPPAASPVAFVPTAKPPAKFVKFLEIFVLEKSYIFAFLDPLRC